MKGEITMEKMKELYEKVAGDSGLQTKFAEIMKEAETARVSTQEKLALFAKEAGYDISVEEAQEYFKLLSEQKEGELSDVELDAVAGGKSSDGVLTIIASVVTVGVACAALSAKETYEAGHAACDRYFQ
jgi:predicted ribosomally synthesized peptide with nif11-like leader